MMKGFGSKRHSTSSKQKPILNWRLWRNALKWPNDYQLDPDGFVVPNAGGKRKIREAEARYQQARRDAAKMGIVIPAIG